MNIQELIDRWVSKDSDRKTFNSAERSNVQSQSQLGIYKNRVNDFFSQIANPYSDLDLRERVFKYTRGNRIGVIHMQELKRIMLSLNSQGLDSIDLKEFLLKIKEK